jgi:hypothetical protein
LHGAWLDDVSDYTRCFCLTVDLDWIVLLRADEAWTHNDMKIRSETSVTILQLCRGCSLQGVLQENRSGDNELASFSLGVLGQYKKKIQIWMFTAKNLIIYLIMTQKQLRNDQDINTWLWNIYLIFENPLANGC